MRALVTGGAGFIGSTLVDRLLAEGHEVAALDNLATGKLDNLASARAAGERFTFLEADIRDRTVVDVVAGYEAEVVFHLAAQADVRVSVTDTPYDAMVNVIGSIHVLEGARAGGTRKVCFASSGGTIYGDPQYLPVDEAHPREPVSPYGIAKAVVGDYLRAYWLLHGLDYTALALANVYGPRQDPHGEAGVIAIFTGLLLSGKPCTIFGAGDQTRDFVYVDDVVDAFVRAGTTDRGAASLFNIGTGEATSVNHLYAVMAAAAGVSDPPIMAAARPGELDHNVIDSRAAQAALDWKPQIDLTTGIGRVIDWFRSR